MTSTQRHIDPMGTAAAKPRCVIIGSGLGGSIVANGLTEAFDVTMIEFGHSIGDMQDRVNEVGRSAGTYPNIGAGPGGSTSLWHNALIEIEESVFAERWPFPKAEIAPWYVKAYPMLCGVEYATIERASAKLRKSYSAAGIPAETFHVLFFPTARRNVFESLDLAKRVSFVRGEAVSFRSDGAERITGVVVRNGDGEKTIEGDVFILAAGGIGTPILLQRLAASLAVPTLQHAGCYYEDHPMALVAAATLRAPLYKFWNFPVEGARGQARLPLVRVIDGIRVSFQIRPAAFLTRDSREARMGSVLTKLRNQPWNPLNYFALLKYPDDVLDIMAVRFGIRLPTRHYTLQMVAEQPALPERSIWEEPATGKGPSRINRRWNLSPEYIATLRRAIEQMISDLGPLVISHVIPDKWDAELATAAHHSGTARMAAPRHPGVCDQDAKVIGTDNLYVADGSLIPGSGTANTGLTIGALAARLADHLSRRVTTKA